jgi:hypothetical protein
VIFGQILPRFRHPTSLLPHLMRDRATASRCGFVIVPQRDQQATVLPLIEPALVAI